MPKKPTITIRPPPPAAGVPSLAEEAGFRTPRTSKASKALEVPHRPKRNVVKRADGRELRRMTVYLPPDVAHRLAVRCAELEVDVSAGLAVAAEAWLKR